MEFTGLHPGVPVNPDVRVGVWVRIKDDKDKSDWFVTEIHGDFVAIVQEGKRKAYRKGQLEVVPS